ncbi:MAG: hypothetical protein OEU62_06375 [Gammaproteobacteria bacterium]|jgi:hypothetical protein|nr:hypothetical protein [Gammaproteobacteria bacterium]
MKVSIRSITLLLLILLTGCATSWIKVDDASRRYQADHYSATLPTGWLLFDSKDSIVLSKDGVLLQYISIQFRLHEKAFEKIEKDSSSTMLPSELAELTIAEFKASQDDGLPSMEILHNAPVNLAGHTGFDIHLRYKTDEGLRVDTLLRGIVDENGFYLIKYSAPTLHYFERDRQTYNAVAESLRL